MKEPTLYVPLEGSPIARLPPMEREVEAGGLRLILLPPGFVEAYQRLDVMTIDVNLNPVRHEMSWNSDRMAPKDIVADSFAFLPRGGEWRIRSNNFLPGLVLEMEPDHWNAAIRESFDFDPDAVGFRNYANDPVAANLGRAGIDLLSRDRLTGEAADALAVEAIGLGLLARLAKRLHNEGDRGAGSTVHAALARERLKLALELIEDRLARRLTVSKLAEEVGMSVSGFASAFKLAMDVPVARYITIRRVARAKALLAYSDRMIAEIALDCGFSGQSHLTRVFKEVTGTTPKAFRSGEHR